MRVTNFKATVQLTKDSNGYFNYLHIDFCDDNVEISRPYQEYPIEQAIAVEGLIVDIISKYKELINAVDNINKDLKLEQYAPAVQEEPKTAASLEDTTFD